MFNHLVKYFGDVPDPRVRGGTDYPLAKDGFEFRGFVGFVNLVC